MPDLSDLQQAILQGNAEPALAAARALLDEGPNPVDLVAQAIAMKRTLEALAEIRGGTKIMIGGAPVTQAFADSMGADGYAPDATGAVALARQLVQR
jgi:methanogenic corrinoid protein MtbC1